MKSPRHDGTGESPAERYHWFKQELGMQGRDILESPERDKNGLPKKIAIGLLDDEAKSAIPISDSAVREGISFSYERRVNRTDMPEHFHDFVIAV